MDKVSTPQEADDNATKARAHKQRIHKEAKTSNNFTWCCIMMLLIITKNVAWKNCELSMFFIWKSTSLCYKRTTNAWQEKETQKMNNIEISKNFYEMKWSKQSVTTNKPAQTIVSIKKSIWDLQWMRLSYILPKLIAERRQIKKSLFFFKFNLKFIETNSYKLKSSTRFTYTSCWVYGVKQPKERQT